MSESAYIPGMCNINAKEVAYRRKAMWFGIALSALLLIVLLVLHVQWWIAALILFVPIYISAIGFLQVRNKFCVSYGSAGKQNADEDSVNAHDIFEEEALKADRMKTKRMNLQALGMTLVLVCLAATILYLV